MPATSADATASCARSSVKYKFVAPSERLSVVLFEKSSSMPSIVIVPAVSL